MDTFQGAFAFIGVLLVFRGATTTTTPTQYHFINRSLAWQEARTFCRVKFTDLATVNNMDDQKELVNTLGGHATRSWIGLSRGGTARWMWSDGSGTAHVTMWAEGEPNDVSGTEWCAEISDSGGWNDIPCGSEKDFMCYERREDGKQRYVYKSGSHSWVESQEHCRISHTDLASIKNTVDNNEVAGLASSAGTVWMGLFKDPWMWSDGKETSFRYWLRGTSSSGDCASVVVSQQGRWVEAPCSREDTFVCEGGLKMKKMIIRMKMYSKGALTALSDEILKKLETHMTQENVTDFKLVWQTDKGGVIFQRQEQPEVMGVKDC